MTAPTEACLFCEIAAGRRAAFHVHEDATSTVFLDYRPLFPGHCLVVPKAHRETLVDLAPDEVGPLFEVVRRVARAVETAMHADGTFVAANNRVSQSVPHFHVHVVPRRKKDGLRGFFWPRQKYASDEEARTTATAIERALLDGEAPDP